jgi:hypothetical protein
VQPPAAAEKPFDLSQLPPLDSLTKDSDFSPFMRPEVPEDLRRQALRKLWVLDPGLAAPDLLDMHMVDYNAVPTFPEGLRDTLFRVGRGMIDTATRDKEAKEIAESTDEKDLAAEPSAPPAESESNVDDGKDRQRGGESDTAASDEPSPPRT